MARRKGSIQKRGPNRYLVRVYQGVVNGKRKYVSKTVNGSWDEANEKLTEMLHSMDTNSFVSPSKITVEEYLNGWLDRKDGVERTTMNDYRSRMELDVLPYLGATKLQALSTEALERLYRELQGSKASIPIPKNRRQYVKEDRDLSSRTVRYTHMILRQALAQAVRRGYLKTNPADYVESLPKLTKTQQVQALTEEETRKLLQWARENQEDYYPIWLVALTTGARPGEILALQWDCVDLDRGTITIRRAMTRVDNGRWVLKESPKNDSSIRSVTLPKTTVRVLRDHLASQRVDHMKRGIRTEFVFCNRAGNPLDISKLRKRWKRACKSAEGVPEVRLYDARHTHATHLLLAGENPKVVSERLGHASVKITLDIYSHVMPSMQENTATKVEAALFG